MSRATDLADLPKDVVNIIFQEEEWDVSARLKLRLVSRRWSRLIQGLSVSFHLNAASDVSKLQRMSVVFRRFGRISLQACTRLQALDLQLLNKVESVNQIALPSDFSEEHVRILSEAPCASQLRSLQLERSFAIVFRNSYTAESLPGAQYLSHMTKLASLMIRGFRLTEALPYIAQLRHLTRLSLLQSPMAAGELAQLQALEQMKELTLDHASASFDETHGRETVELSEEDFRMIGKHWQSLCALQLSASNFVPAHLEHLRPLTNLTRLDIPTAVESAADIQHLSVFRNLQYLTKVTAESLALLAPHFPKLRSLTRPYGSDQTDEMWKSCGLFHTVEYFTSDSLYDWPRDGDPRRHEPTDEGVKSIYRLSRLQSLSLVHRLAVTGASIESIAQYNLALQSLTLRGCPRIPAASFMLLTALTNLVDLNVSISSVEDDQVCGIAKCCSKLKSLVLSQTSVTKQSLEAVAASLKELHNIDVLLCDKVDDEAIAALTPLTSLTQLAFAGSKVTGTGLRGAQYAKSLRTLDSLSLAAISAREMNKYRKELAVTLQGAQVISETFKRLTVLRSECYLPATMLRLLAPPNCTSLLLYQLDMDGLEVVLSHKRVSSITLNEPNLPIEEKVWLRFLELPNLKQLSVLLPEARRDDSKQKLLVSFFANTRIYLALRRTFF